MFENSSKLNCPIYIAFYKQPKDTSEIDKTKQEHCGHFVVFSNVLYQNVLQALGIEWFSASWWQNQSPLSVQDHCGLPTECKQVWGYQRAWRLTPLAGLIALQNCAHTMDTAADHRGLQPQTFQGRLKSGRTMGRLGFTLLTKTLLLWSVDFIF